ncbi:MAG TPA: DUF5985 family protein [Vicinamibacterales bacterium]|jgi:hypothetical protein
MELFLRGVVAMGCLVVSLFFLRFWRDSRDRFFLLFSLAFMALAASYVLLGIIAAANDWRVYVFVVRLVAFALILAAIIGKNRA